MNRIKFGYRQNPEAYERAQEILSNKAKERARFLERMSEENQRFRREQQHKRQLQNLKFLQVKDTSQFNRNNFENRRQESRSSHLRQALNDHQKFETLNQEMYRQKQRKLQEENDRRNKYKMQLERQIQEFEEKKRKDRMMSTKESKLNRSLMTGASHTLPGLTEDYAIKRQQRVMENFLGGGSEKSFKV